MKENQLNFQKKIVLGQLINKKVLKIKFKVWVSLNPI